MRNPGGPLTKADKQVFACFDSFIRLDADNQDEKLARHGLTRLPEYDPNSHPQSPSGASRAGSRARQRPLPLPYRLALFAVFIGIFAALVGPQIAVIALYKQSQIDTLTSTSSDLQR